MKIVFFGSAAFGVPSLDAIRRSGHVLSAVVTTPDRPQGRRLVVTASPIRQWASENGVRCLELSRDGMTACAGSLRSLGADIFVVISFGLLLPRAILDLPRYSLNVHASLLPRHRGASPIQSAILSGDRQTGVSVMRMAEKLDAGDVMLKKVAPIDAADDHLSLDRKLSGLSAVALEEALKRIETGLAVFEPQDESLVTLTRKIRKEDGRIDWRRAAEETDRRIRAFTGWPGSFFFYRQKRVLVLEAAPLGSVAGSPSSPGTVLRSSAAEGLVVATSEGSLSLRRLQAEGRAPLSVAEFLRGSPIPAGSVLD